MSYNWSESGIKIVKTGIKNKYRSKIISAIPGYYIQYSRGTLEEPPKIIGKTKIRSGMGKTKPVRESENRF